MLYASIEGAAIANEPQEQGLMKSAPNGRHSGTWVSLRIRLYFGPQP